jgi:uncharacterized protein YbaR (Trm112 family)
MMRAPARSRDNQEPAGPLDPELLEILVCPLSRAALVQDGETLVSTDPGTRRRYKIDDGIPVLLVEESEALDEAAWQAIMARHGKK